MMLNTLANLPRYSLPEGFYIRNFIQGEETSWADIEAAAGEFQDQQAALERFNREFGKEIDKFSKRSVFLCAGERIIGTATAWYNKNFLDGMYGRLHWVAIHPEHQGKGLAKPLICHALHMLAKYHAKVYCNTQTTNEKAIAIYLDMGFEPFFMSKECAGVWRALERSLNHPRLSAFMARPQVSC